MKPLLCVVSSWVIKIVYTVLVWNTISGTSNLDICFYQCLILTLILHLKVLFNLLLLLLLLLWLLLLLLLLFIIYIVNLPVVRPRSCRVIYYFDTPTLRRRHQLFIIYIVNLPVVQSRSYRVIYYFDTSTLGRRHQSFGRVRVTLPLDWSKAWKRVEDIL